MQQSKHRFVPKLDFLTTPGYLSGADARDKVGLPSGTGPQRVVTQLGVMGFDERTKRMKLVSVHPHVTVEEVKENTGFELIISENMTTTDPPTRKELHALRSQIDPAGIVLGSR